MLTFLSKGEAFKTEDFRWQARMMDAIITGLERSLIGFTYVSFYHVQRVYSNIADYGTTTLRTMIRPVTTGTGKTFPGLVVNEASLLPCSTTSKPLLLWTAGHVYSLQ